VRWPWYAVLVSGPSMVPTLRAGDVVVVRPGSRVRPGQVVVARFRDRPDLLVVKRAVRRDGDGWYVVADNPFAAGDSAVHGPADVVGRVVFRYWPRPRWPLPPAPDVGAVEDFLP
jgi:phage repressor protein C with HTH and peptisase S24 domain